MPINRRYFPPDAGEPRLQRGPFDFAAIFGLLLVMTLVAFMTVWHFWHVSRIYSGVIVGGVPVGGQTRAQALQQLTAQWQGAGLPTIRLRDGAQEWPLPTAALQAQPDLLGAINAAYLVGRQGPLGERVGQQVRAALGQIKLAPQLDYDQRALRQALETLANQVRQPGEAERRLGEVILPATPGLEVDIATTLQSVTQALATSEAGVALRVPLATLQTAAPAAPAVTTDGATPAVTGKLPAPLRLDDERYGLTLALDPVIGQQILNATSGQVDEAALRTYLDKWAAQFDIAPRNARLHFNSATGGVTVVQESLAGRRLDIDATVTAVREAVAAGSQRAALVMVEAPPTIDMNRVAEMGIRELVASGTSYFAGSSAARIRNIEVAAEKFDGLVIPPGEIFSFNGAVEDVSSANGFEDSLIIWGDQTAVGVGGGVCQVSTTVFRAAYSGGFPIVERYNHGYVVSWYGDPGLDATIFTPSVDFRFRNDTGAYLLIEPVVDSARGVITFNFYGTKPDRIVTVGVPQRTDVIEPEPPTYVVNEALAPGQRKQVEWEQKGMTVTVERTIVENGTTRTDTLTSVYSPWQAVYEVGPGTEIPATATPEPAAGVLDANIAITPTPSSPETGP